MTTRALVLGGGGLAGIGWEVGVLAGLASEGIDVRSVDLLVGTSAGSVVASQLAHAHSIDEVYDEQLLPPDSELAVEFDLAAIGAAYVKAMSGRPSAQVLRARIGELALAAPTVSERDRRSVIISRLAHHDWPDLRVLITACDALTGEFRAFSRDDGVGLIEAIAASCAVPLVWPPATLADRRWIDGGMRSLTNADLAAGHDRVLVVAPMTVPAGSPIGAGLEDEVAGLQAAGATVCVLRGDAESIAAFGSNPLDPATRAPSARLGRAQGVAAAAQVRDLWA